MDLGPYNWLSDPAIAKLAIVIPGMLGGGINVLIYYSAMRSIPEEIIEAAKIDGANPWQRILKVIFPGLHFIIGIQFIAFIAGVFLTFEPMYIMTGGGPVNSTRVLTMLVFEYAFKSYRFGMAGAISLIMFLLIAVITLVQLRLSKDQTS
ncbi:Lactose transport system permease protein LacF [compost metagenome]